MFYMARLPMRVAVPRNHPLIEKEQLTYEDLNGYDLITINGDINRYYPFF